MAIDKAVDSAQLEAAITATADAIREKTGNADLVQWLAESGFAEAIGAIETGGGVTVESGSFTLAETGTHAIYWNESHDTAPDVVFLMRTPEESRSNNYYVASELAVRNGDVYDAYTVGFSGSAIIGYYPFVALNRQITNENTYFAVPKSGFNIDFIAGIEVKWYAIWGLIK